MDRRKFFKSAGLSLAGSSLILNSCATAEAKDTGISYSQLDQILSRPVLKKELFSNPVIIQQLSLLRYGDSHTLQGSFTRWRRRDKREQ
jgi:hypothetical protein